MYGGNDPADNSGTLRYVRIAEGGLVAGPNNEINGLTLQGVGHGTTIEYIQVHSNLDDGIEWFGGTVNVRYAVLTSNDDDDIDYDEGFMGNIQYALIEKNQTATAPQGSNDPRGIEANSSDDEFVPETDAVLANVTIIGGPVNNNTDCGERATARHASARCGQDQPSTTAPSATSTPVVCASTMPTSTATARRSSTQPSRWSMYSVTVRTAFMIKRPANTEENVEALVLTYSDTLAIQQGAAQLAAAPVINAVNNGSGFVFDQTDFVGAVDPNGDAWWQGWTLPGTVTGGEDPVQEPVQPASFVSCNADNTVCTITGIDRRGLHPGRRRGMAPGRRGASSVPVTNPSPATRTYRRCAMPAPR